MKFKLIPGDKVVLYVRHEELSTHTFTVITEVKDVSTISMGVVNCESKNGLATVTCQDNSTNGQFWYEYMNSKGKIMRSEVAKMELLNGPQIKGPFIIEN